MRCAIAAMITLVGVVTTASADRTEEVRAAIAAEYRRSDAAFNRKDVRGATHCLAPNFVGVLPSGERLTIAQCRQTIATILGAKPSFNAITTTKVGKITVSGKRATVIIRGRMVLTTTILGKQHKTVVDSQSRDVWIRTGAGWRCTKSTELAETGTFDGKHMPAMDVGTASNLAHLPSTTPRKPANAHLRDGDHD